MATVHRLPRQLGWGLWVLAFVVSSAMDWRHAPEGDPVSMIVRAAMWGGLCALLASLAGYLACLALGTNQPPPPEPERVPLPAMAPGIGPVSTERASPGASVASAPGERPAAGEEEFGPYSPEQVAQAIRSQLATE